MRIRHLLLGIGLVAVLGGGCPPVIIPPGPPPVLPEWDAQTYPWPMFGHDPRRTSRSTFDGPASATLGAPGNWVYTAVSGAAINMQAVVTNAGVYFGAWGVLRRDNSDTPDEWDKSDGRWYGLRTDSNAPGGVAENFAPVRPALTPAGYLKAGRTKLPRDEFWCGADNDYLVSFYNGTVEGTPCIDPTDGTQYVGRGDGRLFAIDPATGGVKWSFQTFNPQDPTDPDGGGEIVGGPLYGPGQMLYFGTLGVPWPGSANDPGYETNALYAVTTAGQLVWRYPSAERSLSNWLLAPPALSPDGRTLYIATFAGDAGVPGELMAINLTVPANAPDSQRLRWKLSLRNSHRLFAPNVYVRALAVGVNGRVFCAGGEVHFGGLTPVFSAVDDKGTRGEVAWGGNFIEPNGYPSNTAQFVAGLALKEANGTVQRLYCSTSHLRSTNGTGGLLFSVNPANGAILATFDPSTRPTPGVGGMTAPTLDASGRIFVGIRGQHPALGVTPINGRMYGLTDDGATFGVLWDYEAGGLLDWVPPAIGADGAVYFGSSDVFTPGGEINWYTFSDMPANRSPKFHRIGG